MKDSTERGLSRSCLALALVAFLSTASMADFSGELLSVSPISSDQGLHGFGDWATGARLYWAVSSNPGSWHYEYTLTVPKKEISHIIVEVSSTFATNDIWEISWDGDWEISTFTENNGNPGMGDASLFGLKIDDTDGLSLTITLDSDRVPVWGDFYAKSGNGAYLYNSGFSAADPLAAAANGSVSGHLLVPDTVTVPIPGAVVLGSLGLGFAGWLRRRQMTV